MNQNYHKNWLLLTKGKDTPEVKVSPPLLYLAPLVLGLILHFVSDLSFLPGHLNLAIGLPIIAIGLALPIAATQTMGHARTDFSFTEATSTIVTRGPFRFSRNPIYLGFALLYLGISIAVNSVWIIILLPAAILAVTLVAIYPEEHYLERKFGQAYLAYKSKVRRWI